MADGIPAQFKAIRKEAADLRDYVDTELGEHDQELESLRERVTQLEQKFAQLKKNVTKR